MSKSIEAKAVESFVNHMIGAFEAGFVDSNVITLATIYQVMRNHCKDEFGVDVPPIALVWGESTSRQCSVDKSLNVISRHWRKTIQETLQESEEWQDDEIPPFWSPEFESVLNEMLCPQKPTHYAVIDDDSDIVIAFRIRNCADAESECLDFIHDALFDTSGWTVKGVTVHE